MLRHLGLGDLTALFEMAHSPKRAIFYHLEMSGLVLPFQLNNDIPSFIRRTLFCILTSATRSRRAYHCYSGALLDIMVKTMLFSAFTNSKSAIVALRRAITIVFLT